MKIFEYYNSVNEDSEDDQEQKFNLEIEDLFMLGFWDGITSAILKFNSINEFYYLKSLATTFTKKEGSNIYMICPISDQINEEIRFLFNQKSVLNNAEMNKLKNLENNILNAINKDYAIIELRNNEKLKNIWFNHQNLNWNNTENN